MKKIDFLRVAVLMVMTLFFAMSCEDINKPHGDDSNNDKDTTDLVDSVKVVPLEALNISIDKETILTGEVARVTVTLVPENATNRNYKITLKGDSRDVIIFEGDTSLVVRGNKAGKANITASVRDITASCNITVEKYEIEEDATFSLVKTGSSDKIKMKEFPAGSGIYQTEMRDFAAGETYSMLVEGKQSQSIGITYNGANLLQPDIRDKNSAVARELTNATVKGEVFTISPEQAGKQVVVFDSNLFKLYILGWAFVGDVEGSKGDAYLPIVVYEDAERMLLDGQIVMFNVLFEGKWLIWDGISKCNYGINTNEKYTPMNQMRHPVPVDVEKDRWNNSLMMATKDGVELYVGDDMKRDYRFIFNFVTGAEKDLPGDFSMGLQLPAYDDSIEQ